MTKTQEIKKPKKVTEKKKIFEERRFLDYGVVIPERRKKER